MLILFFSTLCVSLVLLIILFSFGFKDIDMEFETKVPEQAPDLSAIYKEEGEPEDSKSESVTSATIRVPSAGPLESLTGISPTDDVAPELQDGKKDADEPPVPGEDGDDKKTAKKDDKDNKKDSKKDDGPKNPETVPQAPVPDLKPLISPEKPPEKTPEKPAATKKEEKPASTGGAYQVYLDGFTSRDAAQKSADDLTGRGSPSFVRSTNNGFIVQVGVFSSKENADAAASKAGAKVRKL